MSAAGKFGRYWLALPLAFYLLLPTRTFYWDGVAFAIAAEKHAPLRETLHPSHLIYIPCAVWLYSAAEALGLKIRALFLLQTTNSLLAAAAVVLIFRSLRRRAIGEAPSLAAALAFAFAATWWKFATDANAYVPAILLLLWANDLLERRRSPIAAGLACCAAMLFHELAILFVPVALWRVGMSGPDSQSAGRPLGLRLVSALGGKSALRFAAAALTPVALAYLAAARIVTDAWSLPHTLAWAVSHSPDSSFSWNPLRDAHWTLLGTLRLFFGGKPGLVLGAAALAFPASRRNAWLWLALYAVFLFFWMPQNTFYRMFYLAPLILLCATWRIGARALPWLAAALFLWNAAFFILPQSRAANNPPLRFALDQQPRWPAGVPIVFHIFHPDLWTISYFNQQAAWIGFPERDYPLLDRNLAAARSIGQPLWIEATAYDFLAAAEDGRRWLSQHEDPSRNITFHDRGREFRFYAMR